MNGSEEAVWFRKEEHLLKNFKLDAEAEAEWRALLKIHEFGRTVIA